MPPTDGAQRVCEAGVTILSADASVQSLCGRTTGLVIPWEDVGVAQTPVIAYILLDDEEIGGVADQRRATMRYTAIAEGGARQATCHSLIDRIRKALTAPAFIGQNLDASIRRRVQRTVPQGEQRPAGRYRSDLELVVRYAG